MPATRQTVVTPQMPNTLGHIPYRFTALTAELLFAGVRLFGGAPYSLGRAT